MYLVKKESSKMKLFYSRKYKINVYNIIYLYHWNISKPCCFSSLQTYIDLREHGNIFGIILKHQNFKIKFLNLL